MLYVEVDPNKNASSIFSIRAQNHDGRTLYGNYRPYQLISSTSLPKTNQQQLCKCSTTEMQLSELTELKNLNTLKHSEKLNVKKQLQNTHPLSQNYTAKQQVLTRPVEAK